MNSSTSLNSSSSVFSSPKVHSDSLFFASLAILHSSIWVFALLIVAVSVLVGAVPDTVTSVPIPSTIGTSGAAVSASIVFLFAFYEIIQSYFQ